MLLRYNTALHHQADLEVYHIEGLFRTIIHSLEKKITKCLVPKRRRKRLFWEDDSTLRACFEDLMTQGINKSDELNVNVVGMAKSTTETKALKRLFGQMNLSN